MKHRLVCTLIYAATTFCLGEFFDGLYGGEPIIYHLGLIHVATAGAVLFAVACVLSLFTLRFGIMCGLLAGILSWPYFAIQLSGVPWGNLIWFARYRPDTLAAIVTLIASSLYSAVHLRRLVRGVAAGQG
jgi:hypothetical protein